MRFSVRAFQALLRAPLRTFLRNPLPSSGLMVVLVPSPVRNPGPSRASRRDSRPRLWLRTRCTLRPLPSRIIADLRKLPGLAVSESDAATARSRLGTGAADLELLISANVGATDGAGHLLPGRVDVYYRSGGQADQAASLVAAAVDEADRELQGAPQVLGVRVHLLNSDQRILEAFLPGVLAFNVINAGLILAAGIFAGYRTSGTLRRIQATGIRPAELVLAHAVSNLHPGRDPGPPDPHRGGNRLRHHAQRAGHARRDDARLPGLSRHRAGRERLGP